MVNRIIIQNWVIYKMIDRPLRRKNSSAKLRLYSFPIACIYAVWVDVASRGRQKTNMEDTINNYRGYH